MKLTIKTNNVPRNIINWDELTAKEQKEFNHYINTEDRQMDATFFRYRGVVYDLGEFTRVDHAGFKGWDGYASDSFFSGVLVKYINDFEEIKVICATYFS